MKFDIGQVRRDAAAATRQRIISYMTANPVAKQHEVARDLGLNVMTVSRHVNAARVAWLESRKAQANG